MKKINFSFILFCIFLTVSCSKDPIVPTPANQALLHSVPQTERLVLWGKNVPVKFIDKDVKNYQLLGDTTPLVEWISADGQFLLQQPGDGSDWKVYDLKTAQLLTVLKDSSNKSFVALVVLTDKSNQVLTVDEQAQVTLWNGGENKGEAKLPMPFGLSDELLSVAAFNEVGTQLAVAAKDQPMVQIFTLTTPMTPTLASVTPYTWGDETTVTSLALQKQTLLVGAQDGKVAAWDLTAPLLQNQKHPIVSLGEPVRWVGFSENAYLATGWTKQSYNFEVYDGAGITKRGSDLLRVGQTGIEQIISSASEVKSLQKVAKSNCNDKNASDANFSRSTALLGVGTCLFEKQSDGLYKEVASVDFKEKGINIAASNIYPTFSEDEKTFIFNAVGNNSNNSSSVISGFSKNNNQYDYRGAITHSSSSKVKAIPNYAATIVVDEDKNNAAYAYNYSDEKKDYRKDDISQWCSTALGKDAYIVRVNEVEMSADGNIIAALCGYYPSPQGGVQQVKLAVFKKTNFTENIFTLISLLESFGIEKISLSNDGKILATVDASWKQNGEHIQTITLYRREKEKFELWNSTKISYQLHKKTFYDLLSTLEPFAMKFSENSNTLEYKLGYAKLDFSFDKPSFSVSALYQIQPDGQLKEISPPITENFTGSYKYFSATSTWLSSDNKVFAQNLRNAIPFSEESENYITIQAQQADGVYRTINSFPVKEGPIAVTPEGKILYYDAANFTVTTFSPNADGNWSRPATLLYPF